MSAILYEYTMSNTSMLALVMEGGVMDDERIYAYLQ